MRLNRREFIGFAAAGAAGAAGAGLPAPARRARPPVLDYWCTWSAQAALRAGADGWKPQLPRFPGDQGMPGVRDNLDEEVLFGPRGLVNLYPESRSRLNFVMDDGWDVPYGADPSKGDDFRFSSLEPDPVRFPSFKGTPGERLKALADRVRGAGWAGLGLWVACQASGKDLWDGTADDPRVRDQIKRKLDWCAEAGVAYWKVDWGRHVWSPAFRAMMSDLRDAAYPALVIEHCRSFSNALNGRIGAHRRADGSWDVTGPNGRMVGNSEYEAVKKDIRAILAASDVFRTYDVVNPLSLATTLERAAWTCALADELAARVVINVEDELYAAAALGFAMGATGLFIRSADIAKLGQLYIDGGVYGGERYLSSEWCRTVLERGYELESVAPNVYAKGGMYGQIIMINTERRLSVAWLGYDTDGYSERLQTLVRGL